MEVVAFIAVMVVLAGVIGYLSHRAETKRTAGMAEAAAGLGFAFTPRPGVPAGFDGFNLFAAGHGRDGRNHMRGTTRDLDVRLFDYRYTTGAGKHQHTTHQTVLAFRSDALALPAFTLRPETFWHRIGAAFGRDDIDFDTHPAFSKMYLLKGEPEAAVRRLFTPPVLDHFEASPGLSVEAADDQFIVYTSGKRVPPGAVREFLEAGFAVLALFRPPAEPAVGT